MKKLIHAITTHIVTAKSLFAKGEIYLFCHFLFIGGLSVVSSAQSTWISGTFEQNVFIENKGQFDGRSNMAEKPVLCAVRQGKIQLLFSVSGITFRYDSLMPDASTAAYRDKEHGKEGEEQKQSYKANPYFINLQWENANANVAPTVEEMTHDYYTYPNNLLARAYKKLICKNLYNGIDVEYFFRANQAGIKYQFIVHPGADVSQIKMRYSSNATISLSPEGDIKIYCAPFGTLIDHAPQTFYEGGEPIVSEFHLDGNTVSFNLKSQISSLKSIVIDPWITATNFVTTNKGYDIQIDVQGNVYVYGGQAPFELKQYNSTGVLQWTYTTNFAPGTTMYGDFTTDVRSGSSYIISGTTGSSFGSEIRKVNNLGIQTASFPGAAQLNEMWRIKFDYINNLLIIGAGGTDQAQIYQAGTIDTSFISLNAVNVLGAAPTDVAHDIVLLALDNNGKCYMATAREGMMCNGTAYNNVMLRLPLPSLSPTVYQVSDGHTFCESGISYVSSGTNGFNGMAATPTTLITYDGQILKKWNPANGAFIAQVNTGGAMFASGGLDISYNGRIYAGVGSSIQEYDSALTLLNTYPVSNTIYDLILGCDGELYACGNGYVQQVLDNLPSCSVVAVNATPAACGNTGTATVTTSCGNASFTYLWSNGQTTATATGLSAGTYTVTVTDATVCAGTQIATVTVASSPTLTLDTSSIQTSCAINNGTATATPTNGTAPYTYSWSNSQTTQTATGLAAGTYTVTVTDNGGCTQTQTITVTMIPGPNATVNAASINIILGDSTQLIAIGGGAYSWTPGNGLSCITCANPMATPGTTTTYCVQITDSIGCTDNACIKINVEIPCGEVFVPNAFSPNNDGSNELECVMGGCIQTFYFAIYDRWGERIFETTDQTVCWDGKYKGNLMNTATFVYYLKGTLTNGEEISQKGNIRLIR